ncbi:MAG: intradiol ring-cleavage dioxygenase [Rhizobiales bacterium]|nr:intradiol ring-cleavage dioxygenase [Hyphomicrobiales bacterium]
MVVYRPSRRVVVSGVLAAGSMAMSAKAALGQERELPLTPHCGEEDPTTIAQTEGPFFRAGSPGRADLVEPGSKARQVELTGFVVTRGCHPVARAVVDLWHADERGAYDNKGYRYRGRVYTDEKGRYRIRTIVPALYPGRTRHYHVNVAAGGKLLLTTQLYFPNEPGNRRDGLYRKELLMQIADGGSAKNSAKGRAKDDAMAARFDFIIDLRM